MTGSTIGYATSWAETLVTVLRFRAATTARGRGARRLINITSSAPADRAKSQSRHARNINNKTIKEKRRNRGTHLTITLFVTCVLSTPKTEVTQIGCTAANAAPVALTREKRKSEPSTTAAGDITWCVGCSTRLALG